MPRVAGRVWFGFSIVDTHRAADVTGPHDSRGWQGRAAGGVDALIDRVRTALPPGAIVLMHLGANPDDGTTYDADALPRLIPAIRAAGYTFTDLRGW